VHKNISTHKINTDSFKRKHDYEYQTLIMAMDENEITLEKKQSKIGNLVVALSLMLILVYMVSQLSETFNSEPITKWYFYMNIIGYAWGLIFVSLLLYYTIKNLIK